MNDDVTTATSRLVRRMIDVKRLNTVDADADRTLQFCYFLASAVISGGMDFVPLLALMLYDPSVLDSVATSFLIAEYTEELERKSDRAD